MQLEIKNLSKQFKEKKAVDSINIKLNKGVYGLLGANGSGKTTLMRMLCGILEPTAGEIYLDGDNIEQLDEHYRKILGYLPQDYGYYPEFSAEEYLIYISSLKGLTPAYAKKRTKELLEVVSLYPVRKKKIKTFSGGMKRRLGIAQALLNNPKVLILDEPTAGLDPKERIRFRKLISELGEERIILLSTHIVADVESIATQILIMKEGRLLTQGTIEELLQQIEGMVWKCNVPQTEVERLQAEYSITNVKGGVNEVELRIMASTKPHLEAVSLSPTLEDLFMYYFEEVYIE